MLEELDFLSTWLTLVPGECTLPAIMPRIRVIRLATWSLVGRGETPETFVARFPNLKSLRVGERNVASHWLPPDIRAFARLTQLTTLTIYGFGGDQLFDLSKLAHLTALTSLTIYLVGCSDKFTPTRLAHLMPLVRRGQLQTLLLVVSDFWKHQHITLDTLRKMPDPPAGHSTI
jgi:hypothetical protein